MFYYKLTKTHIIHWVKDYAARNKNKGKSLYKLIYNKLQDLNIKKARYTSVHGRLLPMF